MRTLSLLGIGSEKYPALTGVRAFGAIVVFFDHFPLWPAYHLTVNVMAFFFTLSGFLIARIYYERAALTRTWLLKYFVNRFARIYPVYFLLLTVAVCLQHDFKPWTLISNYTLTHALFHGTELIIQPSWTLTVEESFYFLAPVFFILAKRHSFWTPFAVAWILLALALAVSKLGISFLGTPAFVISTTFFGHFVEFFAGFYLALALMNQEKRGTLRMAGRRYTIAGLAGVSILVAAMILVYRREPLDLRAIMLINNFLIPVPVALLYWGLMREDTFLARLLSNKVSGLLGRSSYSFYLLHMLIIDCISVPWLLPWLGNRPLCIGLTLIIVWAASVALFAFYEEPVNIYIRGIFRSKDGTVGMQQTLFPMKT